MINIGVIGCGKIAQVRHMPEYTQNEACSIAGVFDINTDRAESIAKQYGARQYRSYLDLLADENIHAVSVCTSNETHAEITLAAIHAGKHVLCEKPMGVTLEECEAVSIAAGKSGRVVMIGHNQRLTKGHRKARELVRQGLIGDLVSFRTVFAHCGPESWSVDGGASTWFFDKQKARMGALADLGIHKTDILVYLTGLEIVETTAQLVTVDKKDATGNPITVEDLAICIYKMSNGAVGTMTASWVNYGPEDNSTILYGTRGALHIYSDPIHTIIYHGLDGESAYYTIDGMQTNRQQTSSGVIDRFVECIRQGQALELSCGEALKSMRTVFASIKSAESGRSVSVSAGVHL